MSALSVLELVLGIAGGIGTLAGLLRGLVGLVRWCLKVVELLQSIDTRFAQSQAIDRELDKRVRVLERRSA